MGKRASSDNRSPTVSLSFNIINPYAVKWAKEHAAETLPDIAPKNHIAVRDLVCRAFTEGIPPRKLSAYIEPYIESMDAENKQQITEYRTQLLNKGYEKTRLDKSMQKLIKRLRRERAELIARTEIVRASNNGRLLAWRAAAAKGLLDVVHAGRIWIGTPGDDRMCETCAKMHHQVRKLVAPKWNWKKNAEIVNMDDEYEFIYSYTSRLLHATPASLTTDQKNLEHDEVLVFLRYIYLRLRSARELAQSLLSAGTTLH